MVVGKLECGIRSGWALNGAIYMKKQSISVFAFEARHQLASCIDLVVSLSLKAVPSNKLVPI